MRHKIETGVLITIIGGWILWVSSVVSGVEGDRVTLKYIAQKVDRIETMLRGLRE